MKNILLPLILAAILTGCASSRNYIKQARADALNPVAIDLVMAFVEQFEGSWSGTYDIPGLGNKWEIVVKAGKRNLDTNTFTSELFMARRSGNFSSWDITFLEDHSRLLVLPGRYKPQR